MPIQIGIIDLGLIASLTLLLAWVVMNREVWLPNAIKFCIIFRIKSVGVFLIKMRKPTITKFIEKWQLADLAFQYFADESVVDTEQRMAKMDMNKLFISDLDYTDILGADETRKLALHDDNALKQRISKMLTHMKLLENQLRITGTTPTEIFRKTFHKPLRELGI